MDNDIRDYLELLLKGVSDAGRNTHADQIPGRIVFSRSAETPTEARLQGILEGLFVARKIKDTEVTEWSLRFQTGQDVRGGTALAGNSSEESWRLTSMIMSVESHAPSRNFDNGSLGLTRIEIFPQGVVLHWRLSLAPAVLKLHQESRKRLSKVSSDLAAMHLSRSLLPSVRKLSVAGDHGEDYSLLDITSAESTVGVIEATVRFVPKPPIPNTLTVTWSGREYRVSIGLRS